MVIYCIFMTEIMSYAWFIAYAVIISFIETYYNITEPGNVEVGIQLTGGIASDVTITIEIANATATGVYSEHACLYS